MRFEGTASSGFPFPSSFFSSVSSFFRGSSETPATAFANASRSAFDAVRDPIPERDAEEALLPPPLLDAPPSPTSALYRPSFFAMS